jgi:hypothetical protein
MLKRQTLPNFAGTGVLYFFLLGTVRKYIVTSTTMPSSFFVVYNRSTTNSTWTYYICHFGNTIDCRTVQYAHSWLLLWRGPSVHFWALAAQPCNFPLAIGQLTCKLFQLCKKSFQGSVLC